MPRRTIHPSELQVGRPLPCDAYDAKGKLLLRKGQLLASASQLERLARHALFTDVATENEPEPPVHASPLGLVLAARRQLQELLETAPADAFVATLQRIAGMVRRACRANADVALASILMRREGPHAGRHALNAAIVCQVVGTAAGLAAPALAATVAAALTMNIGMRELQQRLRSQQAPLDEEQRAAVHAHCERGERMLRDLGVAHDAWLEAVRDHHERPDGSGYPAGKAGDALGLPARLLTIADLYCARVSERDYRPALAPNVALRRLFLNEGACVDEHLAALCIKTLGIYPPGTGVRLRNGSIAVVTHRGAAGNTPKVALITTHDGLRFGAPIRRRGDMAAHAVSEVVDLAELQLEVGMEALWGADAAV
ncbi:phosphohydrolase [Frateuria sp. Soil773]|uniref:HD-GYP domain-containing protein n=1 Tax=Frateuria sp. Soil773 TaxID=1736407 RepID=UPI0006F3940B|nr:HD domain-containing phosphohydrolase [Frateuria sp. Soil773]KRE98570.1 phosphohydrolase [Frateuria sp. Soil773]